MMWINLAKLKSLANPINQPPWKEWKFGPIDPKKVSELVSSELTKPSEYDSLKPESEEQHLRRIAYYVKHGWKDSAITLVLRPNTYPILDGVHRTIAALLRNDEGILAQVEGQSNLIKKLYEEEKEEKTSQEAQSSGPTYDAGQTVQ